MKKKKLLTAAAIAGGAVAGSSYFLFDAVLNRNSKVFQSVFSLINDKFSKSNPVEITAEPDARKAWFNNYEFKEYSITNSRGFRLQGYLIPADNESNVYVFCSHGYRSNKGDFRYIAKYYHDLGYNVFLVDHQAHGASEGKYITFGYYESQDCLLWLEYLKQVFGDEIQLILHGISMGSATVMLMSSDACLPQNVKYVVADCGFTSMKAEFEYALNLIHIPKTPLVNIADFYNKIKNSFNFDDVSPLESVKKSRVPILFVHGDSDDFVPTYMVHELYASCNSEKDLLLVKGAGHTDSYRVDSASYEEKIKEFSERYLEV